MKKIITLLMILIFISGCEKTDEEKFMDAVEEAEEAEKEEGK